MADLTPGERVTIWLTNDATESGIPPVDIEAYVDAMRGTLRAEIIQLGYATDDLASNGFIGKLMATLFFGWRPADRDARAALLIPKEPQ